MPLADILGPSTQKSRTLLLYSRLRIDSRPRVRDAEVPFRFGSKGGSYSNR